MKKRYKLLIFILLILLVGGFLFYKNRVAIISKLVPSLEHDTIKVVIENDTAYINTIFYATNKTFLPITIDSIKYVIGMSNRVYMRDEKFLGIHTEGYGKDTFAFSLEIPVVAMITDMRALRKKTENANYSVFVAVQYSTFFGRIDIPINKSSKFKLPTPPELEIVEVKYDKIRLKKMDALARVKITNFNEISLTIQSIKYEIIIPHFGSAKGEQMDSIVINPRSEVIIDLPAEIKWKHLGELIKDVITNEDTYEYELYCEAVILTPNPGQKPIILNLIKFGEMELKK